MQYLGDQYREFLKKQLPHQLSAFVPNTDGFNCSLIRLNEKRFLFCVRFLGTRKAYDGKVVVPGNYSRPGQCEQIKANIPATVALKLVCGVNFFWNQWFSTHLVDNTVFLVMQQRDGDNGALTLVSSIRPLFIHQAPVELNDRICGEMCNRIHYTDVRLFRDSNGRILCYDAYITAIYELRVLRNRIVCAAVPQTVPRDVSLYAKTRVCFEDRQFDKNWAFIEEKNGYFDFLNWFEPDGVTRTRIPVIPGVTSCVKDTIIRYGRDALSGVPDSPLSGAFSLGTPFTPIPKGGSTRGDDYYEGVAMGHIKLSRSMRYSNPKIGDFIKELAAHIFGDEQRAKRTVLHFSFHYLCYFLWLRRSDNKYTLSVSDAFLLVPTHVPHGAYNFTINFPMGIDVSVEKDPVITATMGIGDFHTVACRFPLEEVLRSCVHDVSRFDNAKYGYKIRIMPVLQVQGKLTETKTSRKTRTRRKTRTSRKTKKN